MISTQAINFSGAIIADAIDITFGDVENPFAFGFITSERLQNLSMQIKKPFLAIQIEANEFALPYYYTIDSNSGRYDYTKTFFVNTWNPKEIAQVVTLLSKLMMWYETPCNYSGVVRITNGKCVPVKFNYRGTFREFNYRRFVGLCQNLLMKEMLEATEFDNRLEPETDSLHFTEYLDLLQTWEHRLD